MNIDTSTTINECVDDADCLLCEEQHTRNDQSDVTEGLSGSEVQGCFLQVF